MPRYIDAEKLAENIDDLPRDYGRFDDSEVLNAIKYAPTSEVENVVHCGECIYNRSINNCDAFPCNLTGAYPMHSNDFCSYGVRKDGTE